MGNKVLLTIVISLSILAIPVFAANRNWDNDDGDNVFQEPNNWASNTMPGPNDQGRIILDDVNAPIIDANHTDPNLMTIKQVRVGHSGNAGDLTMTGGNFWVVPYAGNSGILYVGHQSLGRYYLQGGQLDNKNLYIGFKSGSSGSFMTMSGGNADLTNNLHIGRQGGEGTLNMEGGTLNVGSDCVVGKKNSGLFGDGTLNITGGTINVSDDFDISSDGSPGHVQLDGGLISGGTFVMDSNGTMDITNGTLELSGDKTSTVQGFVDNGWITAFGGATSSRAIKIEYDSGPDKTTVTVDTSILAFASQPSPSNGAVLELGPGELVTLSWTAGDYADAISPAHRIIISETFADVNDRTGSATTQDPCTLAAAVGLGSTYYWSVDEANASTTWDIGNVWSFEIEEYVLIDDFEDYADSNDIVLSWAASGGAGVSLATEYSGQIMRVDYNNNSEATLTYSPAVDFTANGIRAIELWVHGDVNNASGDLTITLEDGDGNSATLNYGDPNAIIQETWEGWIAIVADIEEFTGMTSTNVAKITVGVESSGTGFVDVDDIRLYGSRCMPGMVETSFDGDCVTDLSDVGVIFDSWLEAEYDVNASPPDDNDLLLHYAFDEVADANIVDSSGNGHTGQVKLYIDPNDANGVAYSTGWDAGGYDNGCLDFNGFVSVSLPNDVFAGVASELTVSVWVKSDANVNPNAVGRADFGAGPSDPNLWWDRVSWVQDNPADYIGQWSHYAFVKDAGSSKMRIYHDGLLVAQNKDASQLIDGAGAGASSIGSSYDNQTGFFEGKMDEFRVYDYALPHAEVLYLAAGSAGSLHQPLTPVLSPVDPVLDGTINFKDYEVLASVWMQEILWP